MNKYTRLQLAKVRRSCHDVNALANELSSPFLRSTVDTYVQSATACKNAVEKEYESTGQSLDDLWLYKDMIVKEILGLHQTQMYRLENLAYFYDLSLDAVISIVSPSHELCDREQFMRYLRGKMTQHFAAYSRCHESQAESITPQQRVTALAVLESIFLLTLNTISHDMVSFEPSKGHEIHLNGVDVCVEEIGVDHFYTLYETAPEQERKIIVRIQVSPFHTPPEFHIVENNTNKQATHDSSVHLFLTAVPWMSPSIYDQLFK